ncbi:MAG: BlaI/MecI/CopY family transcriptional regulator [Bacteroidetes bacterium]|nr:MAG: BlaI/MecI/CopY family transcriptional regulator [Bacteroidota bacterium]
MTPSQAELDILHVLWAHAPATVRFVHEHLQTKKEVGYTTTLKQIQRMTEKGLIAQHKTGRSHEYTPLVQEEDVKKSLFQQLVDTAFQGSTIDLVMHALGQEQPSESELSELESWLQARKEQASPSEDKHT